MEDKLPPELAADTICFADLGDGIVVVRIAGRGSFANSVELKKLGDTIADKYGSGNYRIILDMSDCITMDSTFMGVLASIGLRHRKECPERLTVLNANPQIIRLMQTLGLSHFMSVRQLQEGEAPVADKEDFQVAKPEPVTRVDRIIHMIEAHEKLCELGSENVVQFEGVLKYLRESLENEEQQ